MLSFNLNTVGQSDSSYLIKTEVFEESGQKSSKKQIIKEKLEGIWFLTNDSTYKIEITDTIWTFIQSDKILKYHFNIASVSEKQTPKKIIDLITLCKTCKTYLKDVPEDELIIYSLQILTDDKLVIEDFLIKEKYEYRRR